MGGMCLVRLKPDTTTSVSVSTFRRTVIGISLLAAACSTQPASTSGPPSTTPAQQIAIGQLPNLDTAALLAHTKVLSSDEYEGRAPGTKGEQLTVSYLQDQFAKAGLKPGN